MKSLDYKIKFKFINIPYGTKCGVQNKYRKDCELLYNYGSLIFECNVGDTIKFRHKNYEDLDMKVIKKDNDKTFNMTEEFVLYDTDKHGFIQNLWRKMKNGK